MYGDLHLAQSNRQKGSLDIIMNTEMIVAVPGVAIGLASWGAFLSIAITAWIWYKWPLVGSSLVGTSLTAWISFMQMLRILLSVSPFLSLETRANLCSARILYYPLYVATYELSLLIL